MKKIILLLIVFMQLISCSKPSECIESTGAIITKEITVGDFDKILFYRGIAIEISQGIDNKIVIETGENLIGNIEVTIVNNQLIIKDKTTCNWVREYGQTIVHITAKNITEIYSKSEKNVTSKGVLTFPNLTLTAIDEQDKLANAGTGDFYLSINNTNFTIGTNNYANFYINGLTDNFSANFYEGSGRIEAANLLAKNVWVYHRGSNDMIVNPLQNITGNLYSTGNLICKNRPATVNVVRHYIGDVFFN